MSPTLSDRGLADKSRSLGMFDPFVFPPKNSSYDGRQNTGKPLQYEQILLGERNLPRQLQYLIIYLTHYVVVASIAMVNQIACGHCVAQATSPIKLRALPPMRTALHGNLDFVAYSSSGFRWFGHSHHFINRRQISSNSPPSISQVNPPASTRPSVIEFPDKATSSSQFSYYLSLGRTVLSFYKAGLKNVFYNYRDSLRFRRRLGLPLYLPTSPPPRSADSAIVAKFSELLTRSEFQLLRRSAYDLRRMIPFSLMLLICGEFTPLIVLALGNFVTPFTCRMPKQLDKARLAKLKRKQQVTQATMNPNSLPRKFLDDPSSFVRNGAADSIQKASVQDVLHICAIFGISKGHTLSVPYPLDMAVVNAVHRRRLLRWLRYLEIDDRLIVRSGGVSKMDPEEVRFAVEERGGIDVRLGLEGQKAEQVERKWLENWLKGVTR